MSDRGSCLRTGHFKKYIREGVTYGRGFYFMANPARGYGTNTSVVICKVLQGNMQEEGTQLLPDMFDSFRTKQGNYYVIRSEDQVWPLCALHAV